MSTERKKAEPKPIVKAEPKKRVTTEEKKVVKVEPKKKEVVKKQVPKEPIKKVEVKVEVEQEEVVKVKRAENKYERIPLEAKSEERSKDGLERSLFFSKNRDCDKDFKVFFSIFNGGVHYAYEMEKQD